jgi:N-acetylmuramoyl-L-alanine amidase
MLFRFASASVVRRLPLVIVLLPALLLLISPGCLHRRSALRPVYVAPACTAPVVGAPAVPVSPGFDDGSNPASLESIPSAEPGGTSGPGPVGEPPLKSSSPGPSSPTATDPQLQGPAATRNTNGRGPSRAALRSAVKPFANDADDLFFPPKADRRWKYVVLHHSANPVGGYEQIDREHRKALGWDGCGYHFVIGNGSQSPDGQIEVAERWSDQRPGTHCRNGKSAEINDYGIGICLVGDFEQAPPTPRQVEAAHALVAYLRDRYAIPAEHVGTHSILASGPTTCPGRNFPTASIVGPRNLALR